MFLEISMQIYSMVFALSRQINKQKVCKTVNPLCAGNKVFVKYQAEGGVLTPIPNPLCTALMLLHLSFGQCLLALVVISTKCLLTVEANT